MCVAPAPAYLAKVWASFAQQKCLQQGAESVDFTDVHLANGLAAVLHYELKTFLHILLKQLQQVCLHQFGKLTGCGKSGRMYTGYR